MQYKELMISATDERCRRLVEQADEAQLLSNINLYDRAGNRIQFSDMSKAGSLVEAHFSGRAGRDLSHKIDLVLRDLHILNLHS